MGFSRQEYSRQEVVCHSPLQWTTFCQTSPRWPAHLGWPLTAWLSFIELDKAVSVWSDRLVFCDYGFHVSALWCPLTAPTILLGFLLTWTWGISSWLLQQSTAAAPYFGRGVSPYHHRFDLHRGIAPCGEFRDIKRSSSKFFLWHLPMVSTKVQVLRG